MTGACDVFTALAVLTTTWLLATIAFDAAVATIHSVVHLFSRKKGTVRR